jgi:hypothetical protein
MAGFLDHQLVQWQDVIKFTNHRFKFISSFTAHGVVQCNLMQKAISTIRNYEMNFKDNGIGRLL